MNRKLASDLQAWEAGSLSVEELISRHPSDASQIRRLTGVFSEMRALADGPAPDPTRGWNELRSRMAAHVARQPAPLFARLGLGLQRKVALGLSAALLVVPPVALAAANETVRDDVVDFVLGFDDLSLSIFDRGGDPSGSAIGGSSPVELEVGDGGSGASRVPAENSSQSGSGGVEIQKNSPAAPSGKDGENKVAGGGLSSTQSSGASLNGAAGSDGGNGTEGLGQEGSEGESEDGEDGASPDVSPSPSPSPSAAAAGSGDSASTPDVP